MQICIYFDYFIVGALVGDLVLEAVGALVGEGHDLASDFQSYPTSTSTSDN
jgi:hypothetical protein